MRLCSFEYEGADRYGAEIEEGVVAILGAGMLDDLIAAGPVDLEVLRVAARSAATVSTRAAGFRWLPPVRRPSKVIGVATNNRGLQDMAFRKLAAPAFFLKPPSALIGHGDNIVVRPHFGLTHPEPELAIVIGKGGKNIPAARALDHVLGYTMINDITSATLKEQDSIEVIAPQRIADLMGEITWREMLNDDHRRRFYYTYHVRSKGTDTFGPLGPVVVTRDEIPDPNNLAILGFWEDELVSEDSTSNLTFSVERVIAHASEYMTLMAGDVIHMGTSLRMVEGGRFSVLQDCNITRIGGSLSVRIDGIGTLRNPVVVAAS